MTLRALQQAYLIAWDALRNERPCHDPLLDQAAQYCRAALEVPADPESEVAGRMLDLVESFPSLRGLLQRWEAKRFEAWAAGPAPSSGAREAARFVLEVWNPGVEWECGRFDWHRALALWDEGHRAAFLAWLQDPFYP